ncbi:MATE efflux family protein 3 [Carex littledalei]|uniref:Protein DETOXIFICATION n=1 Tax=Carex littledalei TaxID=544730 RepID=A0A833RJA7_9POAL|nr:MATE efflux family protein 3 [Carex littledalei]
MKAICQQSLLPRLSEASSNEKANKRIISSSTHGYFARQKNTINISRNFPLKDLKLQSVALHKRRPLLLANSQSFSDYSLSSDNGGKTFGQDKESPLVSFKEAASNLVGNPVGGTHDSSARNELILLALPAIVAQAIDPFSQLMETAYIGRLGSVELASAGVAVTVFNLISKLFNIPLLSVTTSFVAEEISKNSISVDNASQNGHMTGEKMRLPSVSSALLLASGIGIVEAIGLFFGSGILLNLMGVSTASPMRCPSEMFLKLRALGAPAVVLTLAMQGVFRGFKDTKTPVLYLGVGNLSSVVLLPVLVYSLGLGVTGAALATVASQYLTMFLLMWSLGKRAELLPPKLEDLQFAGYIKSGGLLLGRTLAVLLTMTLGTAMATRQGPIAMAGHQICLQLWLAVSLLSDAMAVSAQALIASAFAKSDYKKVKEVAYYALKIGVFAGIALAIGLGASFGRLAELFTKDPEVLQVVKSGVLFVSASQPINSLAFIFDGLHYGVSDFSYAAVAMMSVGAMSSLFLLFAPKFYGLPGVWVGLTLFMGLRAVAGILRLQSKSGPWWFLHREDLKPEAIQPVTDSIFSSGEQKKGDPMELDPLRSDYDYVTPTD